MAALLAGVVEPVTKGTTVVVLSGGNVDAALLARFHLSSDRAHSVYELMRTDNLSFGEAAVRLGLVTQEHVNEALGRSIPKEESR